MPRILYLCSGSYGAGKTYWGNLNVGNGNTISLASPIRRYLFRIFNDDRVHSTSQDVKNSRFPKTLINKCIRTNSMPSKVPKRLFLEFQSSLADLEDIGNLSVRDLLIIMGDAGRKLNSNYWINETKKMLDDVSKHSNICVDDVRFLNERSKLKEWAIKNYITPIHLFIGEPDELYNNQDLYDSCDYNVSWK